MKMEMHNIEQLARELKAANDTLETRVDDLHYEIDKLKRKRIPGIKSALEFVAECQKDLHDAIKDNPQLFEKPRSTVFYGLRVGFFKSKGKLKFSNEQKVIARIKKLFPPAGVESLVKSTEKLVKKEVEKLPGGTLKKIGCEITGAGDQVLIKSASSDIDKMLEALLKDWNEEASEPESEHA